MSDDGIVAQLAKLNKRMDDVEDVVFGDEQRGQDGILRTLKRIDGRIDGVHERIDGFDERLRSSDRLQVINTAFNIFLAFLLMMRIFGVI